MERVKMGTEREMDGEQKTTEIEKDGKKERWRKKDRQKWKRTWREIDRQRGKEKESTRNICRDREIQTDRNGKREMAGEI